MVGDPATMASALAMLAAIRAVPGHTFLPDASSLSESFVQTDRLVTSRQVTDLHLVNLAASSNLLLVTLDTSIVTYLEPDDRTHVFVIP